LRTGARSHFLERRSHRLIYKQTPRGGDARHKQVAGTAERSMRSLTRPKELIAFVRQHGYRRTRTDRAIGKSPVTRHASNRLGDANGERTSSSHRPWQNHDVRIRRALMFMVFAVVASAIGYVTTLLVSPGRTTVQADRVDTQFPLTGSKDLSLFVLDSGTGNGSVQLVQQVGTSNFTVGAPLVTFEWNSGTHPIVTNGPGVLWLYELGMSGPPPGPEPTVWRISESSGAVLQKATVPPLARPLLAADASGLYLAGAGSFGGVGHGLIFRVGIGARSATTVLGTGSTPASMEFVTALRARTKKVDATVCTRPAGTTCTNRVFVERS
jgi:hypothetical protein